MKPALPWGLGIALVALLCSSGTARATDWVLEPSRSTATLVVSPVKATFEKVSGRIQVDDIDPDRSTFEFVLDTETVRVGRGDSDAYLKSPAFFDAARTPKLTFKSTRWEKAGRGRFRATGDLTMRGLTRSVTCQLEGPTPARKDATGRLARRAVLRLKLSGKSWGVGAAEAAPASPPMADTLAIEIKASFLLANPDGEVAAPVPSPSAK